MSEKLEVLEYNKAEWGEGPWQTEPDRMQWNHAGYACLAVRSPTTGGWCGYVGVPESHPAFGMGYDEVYDSFDVGIHGGLTYSGLCDGHICHVPEPGFPDKVWWLGFDCGHSQDYSPKLDAFWKDNTLSNLYSMESEWGKRTYRDVDYIRQEVEDLANQLRSIEKEETNETDTNEGGSAQPS